MRDNETQGQRWYQAYLRGRHWQDFSAAMMHAAKGMCEVCRERPASHVHHIRYHDERGSVLGREAPQDVTVCCETCHRQAPSHPDWGERTNHGA